MQTKGTCKHCTRPIYYAGINWMHVESGEARCQPPVMPRAEPQCATNHFDIDAGAKCPRCGKIVIRDAAGREVDPPESADPRENETNAERVERMLTTEYSGEDTDNAITIALADIFHLCDREGLEFAQLEKDARDIYLRELNLKPLPESVVLPVPGQLYCFRGNERSPAAELLNHVCDFIPAVLPGGNTFHGVCSTCGARPPGTLGPVKAHLEAARAWDIALHNVNVERNIRAAKYATGIANNETTAAAPNVDAFNHTASAILAASMEKPREAIEAHYRAARAHKKAEFDKAIVGLMLKINRAGTQDGAEMLVAANYIPEELR